MLCEICKGYGDVLGAGCSACSCGTYIPYDGTYMSFGGGVQSTAIAYLCMTRDERLLDATGGQIPTHFIFADTGDEPASVYSHVEQIKSKLVAKGFSFLTTRKGVSLSETILRGEVHIPIWMPAINGRGKTHTPFKRQCTSGWKIAPIERTAKKAFKVNLRKDKIPLIAQWVGISMDEVQRVRTSRERWKHNIYPLILMGWSRNDCISYLEGLGVSAPKSSCIFCPYRSDAQWADLPSDELERATRLENTMRAMWEQKLGYVGRLQNVPSFHQSGVPLKDRPWEKDHPSNEKISGFNNECSGTCGV